jgi:hypothetical protein
MALWTGGYLFFHWLNFTSTFDKNIKRLFVNVLVFFVNGPKTAFSADELMAHSRNPIFC